MQTEEHSFILSKTKDDMFFNVNYLAIINFEFFNHSRK